MQAYTFPLLYAVLNADSYISHGSSSGRKNIIISFWWWGFVFQLCRHKNVIRGDVEFESLSVLHFNTICWCNNFILDMTILLYNHIVQSLEFPNSLKNYLIIIHFLMIWHSVELYFHIHTLIWLMYLKYEKNLYHKIVEDLTMAIFTRIKVVLSFALAEKKTTYHMA